MSFFRPLTPMEIHNRQGRGEATKPFVWVKEPYSPYGIMRKLPAQPKKKHRINWGFELGFVTVLAAVAWISVLSF